MIEVAAGALADVAVAVDAEPGVFVVVDNGEGGGVWHGALPVVVVRIGDFWRQGDRRKDVGGARARLRQWSPWRPNDVLTTEKVSEYATRIFEKDNTK